MKRFFQGLAMLLLMAGLARAQSTTLSGQVTDAGGQSWNNGTFQLTFQPNPQIPQGPYTWTGGTLPLNISGVLNATGGYSVSVPSNTAISPIGTGWNLQVCPQATSPCFSVNNLTIAGVTQVFNVTPPAISISLINPPSSPMLAYSDSEISSAVIGSFYLNIPILNYRYCQAVTGQTCTLWNGFGSGPPPTGQPRLDQVLNQNQPKTFNQGGASLGFTAGPGLNLSGETSPLTVPVIVSCTTAAPGQICDDGTNYHIFVNGVDTLLLLSTATILSGNNGDVAGYKVVGSQVSLQDLGPVNVNSGNTFINVSMTAPLDEDQICWNAAGPPFWVNCTPGAQDTSISGSTGSYIISFGDQLTTIDHDTAGSVSVTVTLPTAITLGINPGFVFSYSNHSTHSDLISPTTWTINGSPSLSVPANTICDKIRVDPKSATNWLTECFNLAGGSPGGGITSINTVATGPAVTITGAGGTNVSTSGNTITIAGGLGAPSATWKNISGNYTVPDNENGFRERNSGATSIITWGTPNSISASPLVATRLAVGNITSTPFTSTSFAQVAGHQSLCIVSNDSGTAQSVTNFTNLSNDTYTKLSETVTSPTAVSIWWAPSISANGSETVTATWALAPGRAQIYCEELQGATLDYFNTTGGASSITGNIHFANSIAIGLGYGGSPTSWFNLGQVNGSSFDYQLEHNISSVLYNPNAGNTALGIVTLGISATPTYTVGWTSTVENISTGMQSIAATGGALLNGQNSIPLFPNEVCTGMSNGTNYDVICQFAPSIQTVGVNQAIYAADQTAGTIGLGPITMLATASAPVSRYVMSGYADVTVVGTSCAGNTTVVLNAIFTDPNAPSATTQALGTFTITTNGTVGLSNFSYPPLYFKAKGSSNIQFSTTYTAGGSCSPAPTVQVTPMLQVM